MIIMAVLWVVMILSVLTVSLSRKSTVDVALANVQLADTEHYLAAWDGFHHAVNELKRDAGSDISQSEDTLFACGLELSEADNPVDRLVSQKAGIRWRIGRRERGDGDVRWCLGMEDEERRLNLNAISDHTVRIVEELIVELGFEPDAAELASRRLLDWIDPDQEPSHDEFGLEDAERDSNQQVPMKNAPLDSVAELSLIHGFTPDIREALTDHVTIVPQAGELKFNFNTVGPEVLMAVARASSGPATNTNESDAESLVRKMLEYRRGADGREGTLDDQPIEINEMPLNAKERVLFLLMSQYRLNASDWFRIPVYVDSPRLDRVMGWEWIYHRQGDVIAEFRRLQTSVLPENED
jgi:type II secretory pathway component PulK